MSNKGNNLNIMLSLYKHYLKKTIKQITTIWIRIVYFIYSIQNYNKIYTEKLFIFLIHIG